MSETLFMEHWINIDPERLARYETMYQWSAAAEDFYAPADIRTGHFLVDFGCGPEHSASVESYTGLCVARASRKLLSLF